MLVLVAACGVMLFKVYASRGAVPPQADALRVAPVPSFVGAMTELVNERLRDVSDPAIRFALQSRIEAGALMGERGLSLAVLEAFFDLERLEHRALTPDSLARLGGQSNPVVSLLERPHAEREALLARDLADQLRRQLTAVVGPKRAALDATNAGALPQTD